MYGGLMARRKTPRTQPATSFRRELSRGLLEEGAHAAVEPELTLEVTVGRVLERDASLLENADEDLDQGAVELGARDAAQLGDRLARRHRLPIRVACGHHVVRVG